MKTYSVLIREIIPFGQEHRIDVTPALPTVLQPGQYCLAFAPGTTQILPVPLFPCGELPDGLYLCGKSPPFWQTRESLLLQGPYGQGFIESLKVRKLAIHAVEPALESRLHLLAVQALQRGADVAWVTDQLSIELPPQVEVLKSADFLEAVAWCDACAVAIPINQLTEFQQAHSFKPAERTKIEVLLDAPMICGNSHCGVCAVETIKGWKLACKDGPVFRLEDLPRE